MRRWGKVDGEGGIEGGVARLGSTTAFMGGVHRTGDR